MNGRRLALILVFLTSALHINGQGESYNWCFGDSALIKYSNGIMTAQSYSATQSSEINTTISDKLGNLLFYIGTLDQGSSYLAVFNKNHQIMINGDSLFGYSSSTNGGMIVPFPDDTSKYYILTQRVDFFPGTYYYYLYKNVIDISLNGGNGEVIQKNDLLLNQRVCEKMALVKHGNGKDWWFLTHNTDSDYFYVFLIDSSGINNPIIQNIGSSYNLFSNVSAPYKGHWGEMIFSNDGSKLLAISNTIIDYFYFDRCTGILSNYLDLAPLNPSLTDDFYYGCSFSPNDSIIYVSSWESTIVNPPPISGDLYQFDLIAPDIRASRQTIYSFIDSDTSFGQHQIAPDGKIYIVTGYRGIPSLVYDSLTMHLSTIDNPNVLGMGCNFNLSSFNLNGHRALQGLPNMPNYNLGELTGSPCDTLTGLENYYIPDSEINVFPNPNNGNFSIRYSLPQYWIGVFEVFDVTGRKVYSQTFPQRSKQQMIKLPQIESGIYNCVITSENKMTSRKIVIIKE